MSLNDTADRWIPGLLPDRTIAVRPLLPHTGGLFYEAESTDHQHRAVVLFNTDSLATDKADGAHFADAGRAFHRSCCDN